MFSLNNNIKKPIFTILIKIFKSRNFRGGVANFELLMVLALIAIFSVVLVFGFQKYPPIEKQLPPGYACCDSGDGALCTPNVDVKLRARVKGVESEYQLLKSNMFFTEGVSHMKLLPATNIISGVDANQYVYYNDISEDNFKQSLYVVEGGQCRLHGPRQTPMDTLHAGGIEEGCEAIPDDLFLYLCTANCNGADRAPVGSMINAYIRSSDIPNPGIPETIRNCDKPTLAEINGFSQRLINLPSPSSKPDLQLETFYAASDGVMSNWFAPFCKPAIYLYPEKESEVHVRVSPIGEMLITIPEYPKDGWIVKALPNGDIFYKSQKFDYLFYEASIPDDVVVLPDEGFVVPFDDLSSFIPELVSKLGLNKKETDQFTDYWLKVLPRSSYYQIKIVDQKVLGTISPLYLIPYPQTSIRISLHFTPLDKWIDLKEPVISTPERIGFTVVEWGGLFKRDKTHPFSCFM